MTIKNAAALLGLSAIEAVTTNDEERRQMRAQLAQTRRVVAKATGQTLPASKNDNHASQKSGLERHREHNQALHEDKHKRIYGGYQTDMFEGNQKPG